MAGIAGTSISLAALAEDSDPTSPLPSEAAQANITTPQTYRVRFETTKGVILIEVHRDWAPHGADRFYNLVRAGYYNDTRFFRVKSCALCTIRH